MPDTPTNRTVIFDLDGTLVDVVPLFIEIFNTLAPEFGYTPLTPQEIETARTTNLRSFLFRKLGLRFWLYGKFAKRGQAAYLQKLDRIQWFPGMPELVQTLQSQEISVAILSSNSQEAISHLLGQVSLTVDFIATTTLSGKAAALKKSLAEHHLDPSRVIYVGDEIRDVRACQKAGVPVIAVTWGLNTKAALEKTGATLADTPEELAQLLLR